MARDPDDEDDALRWEGDDDSTLAPGWRRVGTSVPLTSAPGAGATTGEGEGETTDAAASASPTEDVDEGAPAQPGSAELVLLGVFGGVYLLYTLGWILSVVRVQNPAEDPVGAFMFSLGLWLAVLAPALWFGVTFALTRSRPRARLVWLLVGAIVLLPIAFVAGGDRMTAEVEAPARRIPFWLEVALAIAFGLFFAYDAWEAVGNLVGLAALASTLGTSITALGWVVLIAAILLPILLFAIAFLVGRRRTAVVQVALYLTGLAVSAALYLDILLLFGPGALLS